MLQTSKASGKKGASSEAAAQLQQLTKEREDALQKLGIAQKVMKTPCLNQSKILKYPSIFYENCLLSQESNKASHKL